MKPTRFANLLMIGLALSAGALGCRTSPQGVTRIPGRNETKVADLKPDLLPEGTNDLGMHPLPPPDSHKNWIENPTIFKASTVYFDFDSSVVKAGEKSKITSVADYLKGNPQTAVRVEGNCDERGTEEYNRSLGERRALAVREDLISQGIDPTRVDTKSWGEDNPANVPGHNEEAWRQNRRDEFILLTPPPK